MRASRRRLARSIGIHPFAVNQSVACCHFNVGAMGVLSLIANKRGRARELGGSVCWRCPLVGQSNPTNTTNLEAEQISQNEEGLAVVTISKCRISEASLSNNPNPSLFNLLGSTICFTYTHDMFCGVLPNCTSRLRTRTPCHPHKHLSPQFFYHT